MLHNMLIGFFTQAHFSTTNLWYIWHYSVLARKKLKHNNSWKVDWGYKTWELLWLKWSLKLFIWHFGRYCLHKPTVSVVWELINHNVFLESRQYFLVGSGEDVLPALQKSSVIYQFSCHCDSQYVGRTSQRLQDRIKQNVLKSIRSCSASQKRLLPARRCKSLT